MAKEEIMELGSSYRTWNDEGKISQWEYESKIFE